MKTKQAITTGVFLFTINLCSLNGALAQTEGTEPPEGEPEDSAADQTEDPVVADETEAADPPPTAQEEAAPPAASNTETSEAAPPLPPPAPAPAPVSEPPPVRVPGRGLRIAGASVLGGGYGASMIWGLFMLDLGKEEGGYYFIPLAGGFIGGGKAVQGVDGDGRITAFMLASMPSIIQTAGLILLLVGIGKGQKWKKEQAYKTLASISPIGPAGAPGLSISGRF
ncbi:MAG: hypothetical protein GY854_24850 [Deltaproteobacteria bacterium]|nr:hypothetical protein [Deltaproteobacteria bacterium]